MTVVGSPFLRASRGAIVAAALSLSTSGCFESLDEGSVNCRVERQGENCPSGYQCRAVPGSTFGRCCKPDDKTCGVVDASLGATEAGRTDARDAMTGGYDGPMSSEAGPDTASALDGRPIDLGADGNQTAMDAERDAPLGTGGVGGSAGTGGAASTGGMLGIDAASATGGAVGTGGSLGIDAPISTGGAIASGGVQGTGGAIASGGVQGTGGAIASGGVQGTGGVIASGGAIASGGVIGTGGITSTGGSPPGTGGAPPPSATVVVSHVGAYWDTVTATEVSSGTADVTVNETAVAQTWEGFGGAFNELGWKYLTSVTMQAQAATLLFDPVEGAGFAWGRIPMGASDYAESRFTYDDNGTDVIPDSSESNRPPADTSLSRFSLDRDAEKLIPYIKAAQGVNPGLRFWASPWTPPVWMKAGYKKDNASGGTAMRPSYFDGGSFKSDASLLTAYAQYFGKFVSGYKERGIQVEVVSPQNEPSYDQNYPSCLWDESTYVSFIKALGPVMNELGVKVMLGTLSNAGDGGRSDLDIAAAVLADSAAKAAVSVVGVQWGVVERVNSGQSFAGLPIWVSEHKAGNYPWNPSGYPRYNSTQAPNDHAYGVESWGYIRDAIKRGRVTSYNAWNMVLDKVGLGNDTSRDWKQNALLVAADGKVTATPAYYVFRHLSRYAVPGSTVVGTSGGDAVAFRNPDGSIVAVMYNSGSANSSYAVKIAGKTLQFSMPAAGWATVKYKP